MWSKVGDVKYSHIDFDINAWHELFIVSSVGHIGKTPPGDTSPKEYQSSQGFPKKATAIAYAERAAKFALHIKACKTATIYVDGEEFRSMK